MLYYNHSKKIIIMLGTNDCKSWYENTSTAIAEGADKLIRQVKAYSSDIKILLISPIHLADDICIDQMRILVYNVVVLNKSASAKYALIGNFDFPKIKKFGKVFLCIMP